MPTRAVPLLLFLLAAACARTAEPAECRADSQCPADARCDGGLCTADGRPVASLAAVPPVEAFALALLDGSASHDPDPGDAVVAHRWAVRAVDAPCPPPEVAGAGAVARVRFGCAGVFEVSLVVLDGLGVASAPAVAEVRVAPPAREPAVHAGPDLAVDHRCGGDPLVCRTETAVSLTAVAAAGAAVRWSVEPPVDRPLDATRRVRFVPGADAPAPRVELETDGAAISGDWIFRVEARDEHGVLGSAATRVSVRNRAPVVTLEPAAPFPHAFDASRSVFTSSGALAWRAVDPDGDPVEVAGVWRHAGDGDARFDGSFAGTAVTFEVEVPYAGPADALALRGGEGLSRRVEVMAVDSNRMLGRGAAEVEIGNRPPVAMGGAAAPVVPHVFDAARSRYVATVGAWTFADPDGDPLLGSSDGVAPCDTTVVDGDVARVVCSVPYEGVPAVDRLAGVRACAVDVRDPWDRASGAPVHTVVIANSPPALARTVAPATVCADVFMGGWDCWASLHVGAVTFDVAPAPADPDGDPVLVAAVPAPGGAAAPDAAVCAAPECVPFRFFQPERRFWCDPVPGPSSFLAVTDGAASVQVGVSPENTRCGG